MAEAKLPYVTAYGNITKALEKIQQAATPERFTQDFLATKLGLKGGTPKPVIPFFKRVGFLGSDGAPTDLYKRFRNPAEAPAAAFQALRNGYQPLFEANEYAHELSDKDLKGLVISQTGIEGTSVTLKAILGSFKALRAFADDSVTLQDDGIDQSEQRTTRETGVRSTVPVGQLNLGYTIMSTPVENCAGIAGRKLRGQRDFLGTTSLARSLRR